MMRYVSLALMLVALFGCGGNAPSTTVPTPSVPTTTPEPTPDPAVRAVERYLQAKVGRDEATIAALLCASMESVLVREVNAFSSVTDAKIEGMSCQRDVSGTTVTCSGVITASYGSETNEFPLSTYRVIEEDGEWKWCGEGT